MNAPSASQGLERARDLLSAHLAVPASAVATAPTLRTPRLAVVDIGEHRFTLAWTASGSVGPVARVIEALNDRAAPRDGIALVVTPYMGEAGAARWQNRPGSAKVP